ncbi:winged helix-turn-helix transcriptional regulator [Streptomyces tsukubensis]|uniref:Transcriptional regulator n=1 Tax=Streptomyces tsukubensis TaxID=83656 RepID=A0A1V4A2D4_9ACTN|nr:helix-turn-helix domain-containing protein [Streptomyces tsukubensis]OON73288.1 transcriptional regulator [Streptomyces tsukubensis]QFR94515.1 transcriptional regulator [Streptomyces tsukubensis]
MAGTGDESEQACSSVDISITRVFALLGKRWTGPIVSVLLQRPVHFADLRRAVPGISERMLSDRLTELGGAGLVVREVNEGPPLRVAYRLTPAGAELRPALDELAKWADKHLVGDNVCTESMRGEEPLRTEA